MRLIRRAQVREGQVTLALPLPEGTEVTVEITAPEQVRRGMSAQELLALPVFGMWADREDMADSVGWLDKERQQWQERLRPPD